MESYEQGCSENGVIWMQDTDIRDSESSVEYF